MRLHFFIVLKKPSLGRYVITWNVNLKTLKFNSSRRLMVLTIEGLLNSLKILRRNRSRFWPEVFFLLNIVDMFRSYVEIRISHHSSFDSFVRKFFILPIMLI